MVSAYHVQKESTQLVSMNAYLVLEDRTGYRVLMQMELDLGHAISVYLGPFPMWKNQLSANNVPQAW